MLKQEESAQVVNDSGIPLQPYYGPERPGEFPFTRGLHEEGYRTRLWTMRQYAGFGTPRETNERFKRLLSQGQTGLSTAFDLPTQMGYDADHPRAKGEVGRVGVSISSIHDFMTCFEGIPLDEVSVSMTINATAPILLSMLVVTAERRGIPVERLSGTTQNDILKEYIARGTYAYPPKAGLKLAVDVIEFCARRMPRWNPISVSGYHIREAGATAIQEMGIALANARLYVRETLARGVAIDDFAGRISWIFNTHNDFFQEVAKYRALRRLWATMMRDEFGARHPKSCHFRTHTQTAGVTLMAQQPENNIVRAAFQALAAVLGGVQSLALSCFDEASSIPTEFAQQLALRTQQVIAHEMGVTKVTDPFGGSHYVEYLTDSLEKEALELVREIEEGGGPVVAIESGQLRQIIDRAAYEDQQGVEEEKKIIVGVNRFTESVPGPFDAAKGFAFKTDSTVEGERMRRLAELRTQRDEARTRQALSGVRRAAREGVTVMEPILAAVRMEATLGEISDALRAEYGEYQA